MTPKSPLAIAWPIGAEAGHPGAGPEPVPVGVPLDAVVTTLGAHPSNQLTIERHAGDRVLSPVRAWPERFDPATGIQHFRALLPALGPSEIVEYRPILSRAGQVLESLPPRTVQARPEALTEPPSEAPASPADVVPRYEYSLEFLGALNVQLAKPPESFGPVSDGLHVTFYIASGEVSGPKINAKIRGEGGDWMLIRRDGVGVCDVRITYETTDGALLLSRYYGIFDLGPDGYARALKGEYDPVPPLVVVPQFVTSHPDWLWINRLQCVGVGRVTMADLRVRFDIYAIRAGEPLPSSGLPPVDGAAVTGVHR